MITKNTIYRDGKGNVLNKSVAYASKIVTYENGLLVKEIPLDQYHDQLFIELRKRTYEGFNAVWRIIDLIQANRAKKSEVHMAIIKAVAISVVINIFICMLIVTKLLY